MKKLQLFVANLFVLKIITVATGASSTVQSSNSKSLTHESATTNGSKDSRAIISPRMDFDEWTPLGRGDPLKNDPTFDYLPPVLDKVHYWKSPPPSSINQRLYSTTASIPSLQAVNYNRRFFLTDFSNKESSQTAPSYVQYVPKRPQVVMSGYHYPIPRTPLPMLTPPPYSQPSSHSSIITTVKSVDMTDIGNVLAESKHPPIIRTPPPAMTSVKPFISTTAIKVLLEKEVDRTTVTIGTPPLVISTTSNTTPKVPPTSNPIFPNNKHSFPSARPMYLIIQGHSKVKTYGLANKPDDALNANQFTTTDYDHNHISNHPEDESNRRDRND